MGTACAGADVNATRRGDVREGRLMTWSPQRRRDAAMDSVDGRVGIITGAAAGIGRAAAEAFAAAGARLVLADRDGEGVGRVAQRLRDTGADLVAVRCDVSDEEDVAAMVAAATDRWGRLDIAFNNAGAAAPLERSSRADWDRTIAVNLTGTWLCMRAEIAAMRAAGGGAIVNCSSIAGLVGFPAAGAYVASKHGIVGLTRSAALDLADAGIRVNAICPGVVDTPMVTRATGGDAARRDALVAGEPIGRMGAPEEIAHAALWLCSAAASFVTGAAIAVDGGWTAR